MDLIKDPFEILNSIFLFGLGPDGLE